MRRLVSFFVIVGLAGTAFSQTTRPAAAPGPLLEQVNAHFAAWDRDHDGKLSKNEIELSCTDPKMKGPTGAAAAILRKTADFRDGNLSLPEYAAALTAIEPGDKDNINNHETAYAAALQKLAGINREIFPAGLPKGSQLAQGRLGDCFLLAGVGTMAQVQPDRLKKLIEPRPDGMVAVNFADGTPIVLPMPTDAEVIIGSTTRGDGVWGNVLEKAIGERYRTRQKAPTHATPYASIAGGGSPHTPLSMMTGHKVKREGCEMFQKPGLDEAGKAKRLEEIRAALELAFKENRLVVGGTGPLSGASTKVKGLYYNHSYGILGYDRQTDTVHFWNPMSNGFKPKGEPGLDNGYPTSYGRFDCPLKETVMWFGSFSIEQADKLDEGAGK